MTGIPEDLEEKLSAFIDAELDAEAEAEVRAAVAASPELAARLEELRRVDAALRDLSEPVVPADLEARLRARIARERGRQAPGRLAPPRRRRWLGALVAAAAAAALLVWVALPRLRDPVGSPAPGDPATSLAERDPVEEFLDPSLAEAEPPAPATPDEAALAMELDEAGDVAVIELLDLLADLDELEGSERS